MSKFKRLLSLILVIVMLVSNLPLNVLAAGEDGHVHEDGEVCTYGNTLELGNTEEAPEHDHDHDHDAGAPTGDGLNIQDNESGGYEASASGNQQPQLRVQLASVLQTVISQQLIPTKEGGVVPVVEIMHMNDAIRNMIRENKNHQINNTIATNTAAGMCTMDQAILAHYRAGKISRETALHYADRPEQMERQI